MAPCEFCGKVLHNPMTKKQMQAFWRELEKAGWTVGIARCSYTGGYVMIVRLGGPQVPWESYPTRCHWRYALAHGRKSATAGECFPLFQPGWLRRYWRRTVRPTRQQRKANRRARAEAA